MLCLPSVDSGSTCGIKKKKTGCSCEVISGLWTSQENSVFNYNLMNDTFFSCQVIIIQLFMSIKLSFVKISLTVATIIPLPLIVVVNKDIDIQVHTHAHTYTLVPCLYLSMRVHMQCTHM